MRAREWLYEVKDPKVAALQRALRKAGALNVEGPYLGQPLRVDGKEGPNTRYNMDRPEFAGIVRQYTNPSAPHARGTVADADSLVPGEELAPAVDQRAAVSRIQTGIAPTAPITVGPDDYVAPQTAPKELTPQQQAQQSLSQATSIAGAATVAGARPAPPHTTTPASAVEPAVPTSIDPIVRKRQGLPPATTAEIDAYSKVHPPVVGGVVDGSGKPIISGAAAEIEKDARKAAKDLETKQGPNAKIDDKTRTDADAQVKSTMAQNETGGNFDITFSDYLDKNTIKNDKYKTVAQWSQQTLGTPLQLTQLTLDQVKAFQQYKNSVAKDSGAVGAYQFMPDTLFAPDGQVARMKIPMTAKFDQQLQDKIYNHYSAENDAVLTKNKIPLTPGNRYMAHYLGAGGATWVYSAAKTDPNMTIADVFTSHKHSDPSPRNPELAILTAGEMPEIMSKRMAGQIGYGRPTPQQFAALAKQRTQLAAANKPKPPVA